MPNHQTRTPPTTHPLLRRLSFLPALTRRSTTRGFSTLSMPYRRSGTVFGKDDLHRLRGYARSISVVGHQRTNYLSRAGWEKASPEIDHCFSRVVWVQIIHHVATIHSPRPLGPRCCFRPPAVHRPATEGLPAWTANATNLGEHPSGIMISSYEEIPMTNSVSGQMPTRDAHLQFAKWAREYGPIYSLILGTKTLIILSSDEAVKELLDRRSNIYSSRPEMYIGQTLCSGGLRLLMMVRSQR